MRTTLGINVVSLTVVEENKSVCKSNLCGKYRELKNKRVWPVCDSCNCGGKLLESKWKDGKEHCPLIDPKTQKYYWDNRNKDSIKTDIEPSISQVGDSHG